MRFEVWLSTIASRAAESLGENARLQKLVEDIEFTADDDDSEDDEGYSDDEEAHQTYIRVRDAMTALEIADEDMGFHEEGEE